MRFSGEGRERAHLIDQGIDGNKLDLQEVGWGTKDWIALA
jgi:hypothetical protein